MTEVKRMMRVCTEHKLVIYQESTDEVSSSWVNSLRSKSLIETVSNVTECGCIMLGIPGSGVANPAR